MVFFQRQKIDNLKDYAVEKLFGKAVHSLSEVIATGSKLERGVRRGGMRIRALEESEYTEMVKEILEIQGLSQTRRV
jgi:hypothetical protein